MAAISFATPINYALLFVLIALLLPEASASECAYDFECRGREVCCNYRCVQGSHCPCTFDSDCPRLQVCCGGKCRYGSSCIYTPCTSNSDCQSTGERQESCCRQLCSSGSGCVGQYCSSVSDCSPGESCCNNKCRNSSNCIGSSCIFNDDCGDEETCCHEKCQYSHEHCIGFYMTVVILGSVFGSIGLVSACIVLACYLRKTRRNAPPLQQGSRCFPLQNEPVEQQHFPCYLPQQTEPEQQLDSSCHSSPQNNFQQQTTNLSSLALKQ